MFSRRLPDSRPSSSVTARDTIRAWRNGAHAAFPAMPRVLHAIAAADCIGASWRGFRKSSVTRKAPSPHAGVALRRRCGRSVSGLWRDVADRRYLCVRCQSNKKCSVQLEHILKERLHAHFGVCCRRKIGGEMRIGFHARVLVGKGLFGGGVDQQAFGLFPDAAMADSLATLRYVQRRAAERVVEGVPDVRIFGQLDIVAAGTQPRYESLARRHWIVI